MGGPGRPSLARLLGCLAYQQRLLGDARRNRAFHRALAARVRPGSVVLDLGAGTGVWAVAAARLGARRVVAVEREAVLVPVFERARTRFLRRGGALVPEWVALAAAPVKAPIALGLAPPLLASTSVSALTEHVPRNLHPKELRPLAAGRELLRLDLHSARAGEPLPIARARFRVADGRSVGGIAVWVVMGLGPGLRLSTRGGTHWLPTLLPLGPLPDGPGRLDVEIDWNPGRRRWAVRFEGDRGARHAAVHAPLFAWGAVRPAISGRR